MTELLESIHEERHRIKQLCSVKLKWDDTGTEQIVEVPSDKFVCSSNVSMVVCALNGWVKVPASVSILNCIFHDGGRLPKHTHTSQEVLFVIDGSITETVTGKTYYAGDTIAIPAGTVHALSSDYALLTASWRPAFPTVLMDNAPPTRQ